MLFNFKSSQNYSHFAAQQVASGYNIVIVFVFLSNDESKVRRQISCFCFIKYFFNIPIFKFLIQFFKTVNLARSFTNHKFGSSWCDKLPRRAIFVLQQIKQAEWPTATKRHKSFVLYRRRAKAVEESSNVAVYTSSRLLFTTELYEARTVSFVLLQ